MTEENPGRAQGFSRPTDPWFYLHVQEKTSPSSGPATEFIPLPEYIFRYDRGGFWVGGSAFDYFGAPFNKLTRQYLDDFMHTRMLYEALHASRESSRYIVQDLALPYSTVEAFIDYTTKSFDIWPLWLCPIQQTESPTFNPRIAPIQQQIDRKTISQFINIGLWGFGPQDRAACMVLNRDLEYRLHKEFGGIKWLYAHTYYTEEELWNIYDKNAYDTLRRKYRASTLPSVYEKVKVDFEETSRKEREE